MAVRAAALDLPTVDALDVDSYAVFVAEDERPLTGLAGLLDWRLAGGLSRQLQGGLFSGRPGESLLLSTRAMTRELELPGVRLFAFGLGPRRSCDPTRLREQLERAVIALRRAGVRRVATGYPDLPVAALSVMVSSLSALGEAEVVLLGAASEEAVRKEAVREEAVREESGGGGAQS